MDLLGLIKSKLLLFFLLQIIDIDEEIKLQSWKLINFLNIHFCSLIQLQKEFNKILPKEHLIISFS